MIILFSTIYISNLTAIMIGFYVGSTAIQYISMSQTLGIDLSSSMKTLWDLNLKTLVSNETALFSGLVTGFVLNFVKIPKAKQIIGKLNEYSLYFLKQIFLPILPIFILGFIIKLDNDNIIDNIVNVFGPVIALILTLQLTYAFLLFFASQGFKIKPTLKAIKNILPASFTGFTTISSAASIPINIICTEKNLKDPEFARTIIPITANIHTLGSALGMTVLLTFIMYAFGYNVPAPHVFLGFAILFAISKFAVAGIPGGVALVISPLLESKLGFSPEMVGLLTSLYILIDPIGTCMNVTCNGAFAILVSKVTNSLNFSKSKSLGDNHTTTQPSA